MIASLAVGIGAICVAIFAAWALLTIFTAAFPTIDHVLTFIVLIGFFAVLGTILGLFVSIFVPISVWYWLQVGSVVGLVVSTIAVPGRNLFLFLTTGTIEM